MIKRFQNILFDLPIRHYVEAYWEMERFEQAPIEIPIAAVAVMHIVFHAGTLTKHIKGDGIDYVPRIALAGIVDKMGQKLIMNGHFITYGITFTPLGIYRFLNAKPAFFSNAAVAYNDVCDEPLPDLFAGPKGVEGMSGRWSIAKAWCEALYEKTERPLSEVERLMLDVRESLGQARIQETIQKKTTRQVQRKFRDIVGMTAKHYAKLLRFNAAQMLLSSEPEIPLLDVAVRTGYYDVAHLCHDFKELKAPLPGQWARDPQAHTTALLDPLYRK